MAIIAKTELLKAGTVYNSCRPPEGSVFVPLVIPFTAAEPIQIANLGQLAAKAQISYFQSLYIYNDGLADIFIQPGGSQQRINVAPGWQGWIGILCTNPPEITFTSAVAVDTAIFCQLCNFPVNTFLWPIDGASVAQVVTDPVLDALLVNGYLPVQERVNYNGDTVQPVQVGTRTLSGVKTATGSTTILTPAAFYRITGMTFGLSGDAALAAAGPLTIDIRQQTTVFHTMRPYLPAAAGAPATPTALLLKDGPFNYWSRVSGETLSINFSAALTAGTFWYSFEYMETATGGP